MQKQEIEERKKGMEKDSESLKVRESGRFEECGRDRRWEENR